MENMEMLHPKLESSLRAHLVKHLEVLDEESKKRTNKKSKKKNKNKNKNKKKLFVEIEQDNGMVCETKEDEDEGMNVLLPRKISCEKVKFTPDSPKVSFFKLLNQEKANTEEKQSSPDWSLSYEQSSEEVMPEKQTEKMEMIEKKQGDQGDALCPPVTKWHAIALGTTVLCSILLNLKV